MEPVNESNIENINSVSHAQQQTPIPVKICTINENNDVQEFKLKIQSQSELSSLIKSTFGYLLWRATMDDKTQKPSTHYDIISMILNTKNHKFYLAKIFELTLKSFVESLKNNTACEKETNQYKFVLYILGIVSNLTAFKIGSVFFSETEEGRKVVKEICRLVSAVDPSRYHIKRMAYVSLYNLALEVESRNIFRDDQLLSMMRNDIVCNPCKAFYNNEIQILAMKLLWILSDPKKIDTTMYDIIVKSIEKKDLEQLTGTPEIKLWARNICINLFCRPLTNKEDTNDQM
ncbi:uncharacterized protein LOC126839907 [Adelges cooleyi]|uniref:uncharacterized protein LOC126839907 n=1 Tax=Adelges cooleyi TaxID=133065 RepID=UPI00217FA8E1|nr:uncharacterized protein LOC126839907 [Adelges cooleyi]